MATERTRFEEGARQRWDNLAMAITIPKVSEPYYKASVMLEDSDVSSSYFGAVEDIVARCRAIQQKCLRDYDAAATAASK